MTTGSSPATTALVRPQPLGLFDGPAALLLVPPGDGVPELLAALAAGAVPATWPSCAAVVGCAVAGDVDGALAALDGVDGPEAIVDRLVLAPSPETLAAARDAAEGDALLSTVVAAAAYASGLSDEPPSAEGVDGEVAVLALTVRAARAVEFRDASGAQRLLREAEGPAAAVGPVLHARVVAMLADQLQQSRGPAVPVLDAYDRAITLLAGTDFDELRAHLHLARGLAAHQLATQEPDAQRHRLVEATRSYQSALIWFTEERNPEEFALANMNVAIATLAMPMTQASDQVRLGVAVQSLRAALRVFRPDTHPHEWSSSQMNLANALQYLPSRHREENLQEAVELLEEVLHQRSPRSDPLGYGRALANQANALAHLGVFDHAEQKYRDARALFALAGDLDAVDIVDRQLTQIDERRTEAP